MLKLLWEITSVIFNTEDCVALAETVCLKSQIQSFSRRNKVESMDCSTQLRPTIDNQDYLEFENESTEEERYIMELYEQLLESEQAMVDALLEDELICPLCEKGVFQNNAGMLQCTQCSAIVRSNASPSHVKQLIYSGLSTHDQFCSEHANFALFSEDMMNGLFLICDSCAYFIQII